jgi:uncharacterized membrane protein (UPF0127 family)
MPSLRVATVAIATPAREALIRAEVAETPDQIQRGLMGRSYLPVDAGMLFLMGREGVWSFWMRSTLVPLDIIFITSGWRVAGIIVAAAPCTDTLRRVEVPSAFVLEVNGGWAAARGVAPGALVRASQPRSL